jgi:predicted RND superfamily exporter protein
MNDRSETTVPGWFWAGAGLALVWEIIGCATYWMQVTADPATLPLDQRAMLEAAPQWMTIAYALAVWVGLIGAVLLLMRRQMAVPLLLISLVAVIVQFSALFLVPELRDRTPSDALLMPIVIVVACYAIWHFARMAGRRGLLR